MADVEERARWVQAFQLGVRWRESLTGQPALDPDTIAEAARASLPQRAHERDSCCCQCAQPAHKRSRYGEKCARCGKHRPPGGRVCWVDEDWQPVQVGPSSSIPA